MSANVKYETQSIEWKQTLNELDKGLDQLCGMLNTDAGFGELRFGYKPSGEVVGLQGDLDTAQRSIAQKIKSGFDPSIHANIELLVLDQHSVIHVSVRRSKSVPYHQFKGRAMIREGSQARALTVAEQNALRKRRSRDDHNGPWQCDRGNCSMGFMAVATFPSGGRSYNCDCGGEYWPA